MITAPCLQTIRRAWDHICTQTLADASPEECGQCRQDPEVQRVTARVDTAALTGDALATQTACQAWNRAYRQALERLRTAQAA